MTTTRRPSHTSPRGTSTGTFKLWAVIRPARFSRSELWRNRERAGLTGMRCLRRGVLTNACSLWYPRTGSSRTASVSCTAFVLTRGCQSLST